jgi:lipoprotein-anchoring transpeptidase ErfK/SrfK
MARQVLFVWDAGQLVRILPVSTGSGKAYCEHGNCGVAVTPLGEFRVERRIPGLHRSPLGVLYDPLFFHDGFAIHGSPSIPAYPASHGCVRIPVSSSRWLYDHVADGTPVHLV